MARIKIQYPPGATPIDPNEMQGLIPDYISLQSELNSLEEANIADAYIWAEKVRLDDLLTATFILEIHRRMFNQVWEWAGKQRKSNKNIGGVMKENVMQELGLLLANTKYWIEEKIYSQDEIAVRFHHRLVQIHIFPNGNGRHARLTTDLLLKKNRNPKFTWGRLNATSKRNVEESLRLDYLQALRSADNGDFQKLLVFVRT